MSVITTAHQCNGVLSYVEHVIFLDMQTDRTPALELEVDSLNDGHEIRFHRIIFTMFKRH